MESGGEASSQIHRPAIIDDRHIAAAPSRAARLLDDLKHAKGMTSLLWGSRMGVVSVTEGEPFHPGSSAESQIAIGRTLIRQDLEGHRPYPDMSFVDCLVDARFPRLRVAREDTLEEMWMVVRAQIAMTLLKAQVAQYRIFVSITLRASLDSVIGSRGSLKVIQGSKEA